MKNDDVEEQKFFFVSEEMLQFSLCEKMVSMNGTGGIINKIIGLHFARSIPWQKWSKSLLD